MVVPGAGEAAPAAADAARTYDAEAELWRRSSPVMWSDVTARPWVSSAVDWAGREVLDLGCGEGYVARRVLDMGASSVVGVDVSAQMVALARRSAGGDPHQRFVVGDVSSRLGEHVAAAGSAGGFSAVLAVFVSNYLTVAGTAATLSAARALCVPGASAVVVAPHPLLPWVGLDAPPVFFDHGGARYGDTDVRMAGRLWRLDGSSVSATNHHKRLDDWVALVRAAGWSVDELVELSVPDAFRAQVHPSQLGVPLHLGLVLSC